MLDSYSEHRYGFDDLRELVRLLRSDSGCPWDRAQTHGSIRRNFIEEVYEVCEAIDNDDPAGLREELGDVLLHVVFHAGIEEDAGRFTIDDVCDTVVRKMISRHPALFGGEESLDWDEIKRREKGLTSVSQELGSVARSLPALWRAEKLQSKAEKAGIAPTSAVRLPNIGTGTSMTPTELIGEYLFSVVMLARELGIDPEQALNQRSDAFLAQVSESQKNSQDTIKQAARRLNKE